MDGCAKNPSGIHQMKFRRWEMLGTTLWIIYRCVHCGEEFLEAAEDKDKGRDSHETEVEP